MIMRSVVDPTVHNYSDDVKEEVLSFVHYAYQMTSGQVDVMDTGVTNIFIVLVGLFFFFLVTKRSC